MRLHRRDWFKAAGVAVGEITLGSMPDAMGAEASNQEFQMPECRSYAEVSKQSLSQVIRKVKGGTLKRGELSYVDVLLRISQEKLETQGKTLDIAEADRVKKGMWEMSSQIADRIISRGGGNLSPEGTIQAINEVVFGRFSVPSGLALLERVLGIGGT
jgi:hypothetical protein